MSLTVAPDERPAPSAPAAAGDLALSLWCVTAAFGAYFCMYGFRKPFAAAGYEAWGRDCKTMLVAAQGLGYMLSKFIGIRVVAAMRPERRATSIVALIASAQLALLLFALTPPPFNAAWLFANGLPLGMVFGLVIGFLEGRRLTEALTAGLCASFILADGVTKSVGRAILDSGVSEAWMPFTAGLVFLPGLLLFAWMLHRIPPPSREDVASRGARPPMNSADRRRFFSRYAFGVTAIVAVYLAVSVLRGVRGDFALEIWKGLGRTVVPDDFSLTELLVALGVFAACGMTVFVRDNRRAFHTAMSVAMTGLVLAMLAAGGWQAGLLNGFAFMVLAGLGLYLPYVAVHTTIFERLIAITRDRTNIGFLMYLADAFGYLGLVAVMLAHNAFGGRDLLGFFLASIWVAAVLAAALLLSGWVWFARLAPTAPDKEADR